jgi:hypothetical protein
MRNARVAATLGLMLASVFAMHNARAEGAADEAVTGIKVGANAPELSGGKWLTPGGKPPALAGKVYIVDFWRLD